MILQGAIRAFQAVEMYEAVRQLVPIALWLCFNMVA